MMDFGDKGIFAVPVVMMNFGDRGVFVRIPFHSATLFFWALYERCSSFFTGNSARSQNVTQNMLYDTRAKRHAFYMGRVRITQTSQNIRFTEINLTNLFHDHWNRTEL